MRRDLRLCARHRMVLEPLHCIAKLAGVP